MPKIRDIMTSGVECVSEKETMLDAAKKMLQLNVGALPICGEDNRLKGMLTDRDIVVKVLAAGKDPASTTAMDIEQGKTITIDADASAEDALQVMTDQKVRRLPVLENKQLVGMVSQADIATNLESPKVADLVASISAAP